MQSTNNNNNDNNGLLTVYPPSGSSPVKNYNIYKKEKLQYTTKIKLNWNLQYKKNKQKYRTIKGYCIKINTTQYTIYKLFTNVI